MIEIKVLKNNVTGEEFVSKKSLDDLVIETLNEEIVFVVKCTRSKEPISERAYFSLVGEFIISAILGIVGTDILMCTLDAIVDACRDNSLPIPEIVL